MCYVYYLIFYNLIVIVNIDKVISNLGLTINSCCQTTNDIITSFLIGRHLT